LKALVGASWARQVAEAEAEAEADAEEETYLNTVTEGLLLLWVIVP